MHLAPKHLDSQWFTLKLYHLIYSRMCWTLARREEHSCQLIINWWWVGPVGGGGQIDREGLAEDPVKMLFNSHHQQCFNCIPEVVGTCNLSGPSSVLPLTWWLFEANVARSLVLVVLVTPEPAGGQQAVGVTIFMDRISQSMAYHGKWVIAFILNIKTTTKKNLNMNLNLKHND